MSLSQKWIGLVQAVVKNSIIFSTSKSDMLDWTFHKNIVVTVQCGQSKIQFSSFTFEFHSHKEKKKESPEL